MKYLFVATILLACFFAPKLAQAEPATRPAMEIPPAVRELAGKVVRIDFDVDVDGRGISPVGTQYLLDLLDAAGAHPFHSNGHNSLTKDRTRAQVLIIGEISEDLTHAADADDPFQVAQAQKVKEQFDTFDKTVAARKAEAAGAGVRIILPGELRTSLGLTITHQQLLAESYRSIGKLAGKSRAVKMENIPLVDFMLFLSDVSGVAIDVDWDSLTKAGIDQLAKVTMDEKKISLLKALQQISAQNKNKLAIISDGSIIRVVSTSDAAKLVKQNRSIWFPPEQWDTVRLPEQSEMTGPMAILLKRVPTVNFDAVALGDGLQFLREVTGAKIEPDWPALKAAEIDETTALTLKKYHMTLGEILVECANFVGPEKAGFYATADGVIHFTTAEKAQAQVKASGGKSVLIDEAGMR